MPYSPPPEPPAIILIRSPETKNQLGEVGAIAPGINSQLNNATIFSGQQPRVAYRATIWYRLPPITSANNQFQTKALELGPPIEMSLPSAGEASSETVPIMPVEETNIKPLISPQGKQSGREILHQFAKSGGDGEVNSLAVNPAAALEGFALEGESGVQSLKCKRALFSDAPIVESASDLLFSDCLLLPTPSDRFPSSSQLEVASSKNTLQQWQRQLSPTEPAEAELSQTIRDSLEEEMPSGEEEEKEEDKEKEDKEEEEEITIPLPADVIEVSAERQEFDQKRQIITAEGKVLIRFRQGVVDADRVQVNLETRQLVAQGNAAFTRGEQVLRGATMEYNLSLGTGVIEEASGEIFVPSSGTDFGGNTGAEGVEGTAILEAPLSDRLTAAQPLKVKSGGPGLSVGVGVGRRPTLPQQGGIVNRMRFEAERLDLRADGGWEASNLRLTNDPFSPPELELRSDRAVLNPLSPFQDELLTSNPRLVLDQGFSVPLLRERTVIDRRERQPNPIQFGFDREDRGGFYVQGSFEPMKTGDLRITLAPQFYLERAILGDEEKSPPFNPNLYGLKIGLDATLSPTTSLTGRANFISFEDFPDIEDNFRGNLRLRQKFFEDYTLTLESSFRDRLFNGTLGFQTVYSSVGFVLTSPTITLGESGPEFTFQTGYQLINARTDRRELLELEPFEGIPEDDDDPRGRADLGRFQSVVSVQYPIRLWTGEGLPATPEEGLRYTRQPVVPFVQLVLGGRLASSIYSNEEDQSYLRGSIGLAGQFGHFSREYFDYTGFNITYLKASKSGDSPFLFDRLVDTNVLSFGLIQQIYGPFRLGFQSGINLDTGETVDDRLSLEYSRRTYGVILSYSPRRQIGSLTLRISDFNWRGGTDAFSGPDVRPVDSGVTR